MISGDWNLRSTYTLDVASHRLCLMLLARKIADGYRSAQNDGYVRFLQDVKHE
jgi:hypothetical protein